MNPGRFITFEGIDGAGKSSHVESLAGAFRAQGRAVTVTREPGGTPLAERLRTLALNEPMDALTEALLMFAARREHLDKVIVPALAAGLCVLCDRFTDATFAYQAGGSGTAWDKIEALEHWVQGSLQPDFTILFDVAPEIGRSRSSRIKNPDRFEQEQAEFFQRVRQAYLRRAREHPGRIQVIDAGASIAEIRHELERQLLVICGNG